MPRWQRAYVIAMCAIIGAAFAYAACDWGQWPRLTIQPLKGTLMMTASPAIVTVNYLGTVAWGLGGAAVGAIVGFGLCAVSKQAWSDRTLQLFGAWAITGVVLAGSYYTWHLWPW
jgi:hypothetical protein